MSERDVETKVNNTLYRCPCGWEGWETELDSVCVFAGSQEEPPEYETPCPDCGRPWDEIVEAPLCTSCEDVYVFEEGDRCGICVAEQAEEEACRARGH